MNIKHIDIEEIERSLTSTERKSAIDYRCVKLSEAMGMVEYRLQQSIFEFDQLKIAHTRLLKKNKKLKDVLMDILEAAYKADSVGELYESFDGDLLKKARDILEDNK